MATKRAGARSAGNPHAACDEEGAGNGIRAQSEAPALGKSCRQRLIPVPNITAPALDPTVDFFDAFPDNPEETHDTDRDGVGDNADADDDGDGFSDEEEVGAESDPLDQRVFPSTPHSLRAQMWCGLMMMRLRTQG